MSKLFRNDSPGALTRERAVALEKKRQKQRAEARALAAQGRGGDTELAHLTPGEMVIPRTLQTPELIDALRRAAAANGIPFERLRIGSGRNRINPNTGVAEFDLEPDEMPELESLRKMPFEPPSGQVDPNIINGISDYLDPQNAFMSEDPETIRRAHIIYGETGNVYPQRVDPSKNIYNAANWDPDSAAALAEARTHIGVVAGRNPTAQPGFPNMSNDLDMQQWNRVLDAARASRDLDQSFDPAVKSFYMWQKGSAQDSRVPNYDTLHTAGPFYTSGGGKRLTDGTLEVPSGNNMYIDFYHWQK